MSPLLQADVPRTQQEGLRPSWLPHPPLALSLRGFGSLQACEIIITPSTLYTIKPAAPQPLLVHPVPDRNPQGPCQVGNCLLHPAVSRTL